MMNEVHHYCHMVTRYDRPAVCGACDRLRETMAVYKSDCYTGDSPNFLGVGGTYLKKNVEMV